MQPKHNWLSIKQDWLAYINKQSPYKTLSELSKANGILINTLSARSRVWKNELKLGKRQALAVKIMEHNVDSTYLLDQAFKDKDIDIDGKRLNADTNDKGSILDNNSHLIDDFRKAKQVTKEAIGVAVQALIHEAVNGKGASKISAIKEILDRSGMGKETENKSELTPYETEPTDTLKERLRVLLGSSSDNIDIEKQTPPPSHGVLPSTYKLSPELDTKNSGLNTDLNDKVDKVVMDSIDKDMDELVGELRKEVRIGGMVIRGVE